VGDDKLSLSGLVEETIEFKEIKRREEGRKRRRARSASKSLAERRKGFKGRGKKTPREND